IGSMARKGLNHAWNCRPRACASSMAYLSGSYAGDGATPERSLRYADQGASGVGYIASPAGRTWKTTAFSPTAAAWSSICRNSARWASGSSPGFEGQSLKPRSQMGVTNAARNSRGTSGGVSTGRVIGTALNRSAAIGIETRVINLRFIVQVYPERGR